MIRPTREPVKRDSRIIRWIKLFALFLGLYIAFILAKGMVELRGGYKRLDEARKELVQEENRSVELKERYAQVQTPAYIEKMARDKLNMQKDGEMVVLLSGDEEQFVNKEEASYEEEANYLRWWKLVR